MGKGRGGEGWTRGERPNILSIVAWRNNLATFDSQQLATLAKRKQSEVAIKLR